MTPRVYPIYWRDQLGQLAPYLNGRAGVIRIRYMGRPCAAPAFLSLLKSEYEIKNDNHTWVSIRIDHEVYSVRYLSGIRDEFLRKMQLDLPAADAIDRPPAPLTIFTEVDAGRDVNAKVSNVVQHNYLGGNNVALMSRNREGWIKELCNQLEHFLAANHMMVVMNHGSRKDQDEFWRYMWQDGLERLGRLLLVHMVDVSEGVYVVHELAPTPNLEISLPIGLGMAAQEHATDDLADIMTKQFSNMTKEEAKARADTLVRSHLDDIPRLHTQASALLMQLGRTIC